MFASVIICTYRRVEDLERLLDCLDRQTYREFEILVIDGSGEDTSVRRAVEQRNAGAGGHERVRLIESPKGLTRQRNAGLRHARGDVICFLDDDVTVEERFLARVVEQFQGPDAQDTGGICGYDVLHYPAKVSFRWRLRRWLGTIPSLTPGAIDRLGRNVPLSFTKPFSGCRRVGWFSGFCMIYRRDALGQLTFDEGLPTYGGEDRDFSMQLGKQWRLLLCGDLQVRHHTSPHQRAFAARRVFQTAFGTGRSFAKRATGAADCFTIGKYVLGEFLVDSLAFARRPSWGTLLSPFARTWGIVSGMASVRKGVRRSHPVQIKRLPTSRAAVAEAVSASNPGDREARVHG